MNELPAEPVALCVLVLLLGLRHGLDADHLSAIDGLARASARRGRRHARYCGALFSLGHGVVVLAVAALAGALGARWAAPAWFELLGQLVSIAFLLLIGAVNLHAVLKTPCDEVVAPVGLRSRLFGRVFGRLFGPLARPGGALAVAGVGALFALSFDTLSQSALFAAAGLRLGGLPGALGLGLLFVAGMLASDGLNGWWIARLLERSDRAARASRTMTLAVAGASLFVAALGLARLFSAPHGAADEGLYAGLAVIAVVGAAYAVATRRGARALRPAR